MKRNKIIKVNKFGKRHGYIFRDMGAIVGFGVIVVLVGVFKWLNTPPPVLVSPLGNMVYAYEQDVIIEPSPSPTITPTPEPTKTYDQLIIDIWGHKHLEDVKRIIQCESGFNERAFNDKNTNGSWDAGLMQVNSIHGVSRAMLFDPEVNLTVGKRIYKNAGNSFSPWVCARKLGIK